MGKRKPGEKIEESLKEEIMTRVCTLDLRGWTKLAIAKEVGIDPNTVSAYLKRIQHRFVEEYVADRHEHVTRKLAEYKDLRREAWEAYERSKRDAERESEEWGIRSSGTGTDNNEEVSEVVGKAGKGVQRAAKDVRNPPDAKGDGDGKRVKRNLPQLIKVKAVKMRQGRLPGIEYLRLIADTYKAERELLGLDEAIKLDVKAEVLDWAAFAREINRTDTVEQKMADMLNQIPPENLLEGEVLKNGR